MKEREVVDLDDIETVPWPQIVSYTGGGHKDGTYGHLEVMVGEGDTAVSLRYTRDDLSMWTACADSLPDADTTVMTFAPDSDEPIWPAYHDGEQWVDLNGAPIDDAAITHWMDFPEPPSSLARALAEE